MFEHCITRFCTRYGCYDVEAKQTEETMLEQSEDMQIQDYTIDQQNNPVLDAPYNYKIGFESKDDIVTDLTYRPVGVEYKYTKKYDENGKKVLETIYDEDGKPIPFDPPSEKSSSNLNGLLVKEIRKRSCYEIL